ncbi:thiamine pyrophosphate-dependent enzyme [Allokutzneria oryzae]|uniref:2-oxoisovalerate dehydrogenase subunit alpha n=1 Tax=Allokutzneria oryzae TaxID=1378989 RepID=A0ABV6AA42_9PSEU
MSLLHSVDRQPRPEPDVLLDAYRWMVIGHRLERQAAELAGISRPAATPANLARIACQVGAVLALAPSDWLFPTHHDYIALVTRGVDPLEALALPWGDWHCGYAPDTHRVAPQCVPAATQIARAVGLVSAARLANDDVAALVFVRGDAVGERDFAEACALATSWEAPVVLLVQHTFVRHSPFMVESTGEPDVHTMSFPHDLAERRDSASFVDSTDVLGVFAAVTAALDRARTEDGPVLLEALPYRVVTRAGAGNGGDQVEVEERESDPVALLEAELREFGVLDDAVVRRVDAEAEAAVADLRDRLTTEPRPDPAELFDHVYAEPTPQLREQQALLRTELGPSGKL